MYHFFPCIEQPIIDPRVLDVSKLPEAARKLIEEHGVGFSTFDVDVDYNYWTAGEQGTENRKMDQCVIDNAIKNKSSRLYFPPALTPPLDPILKWAILVIMSFGIKDWDHHCLYIHHYSTYEFEGRILSLETAYWPSHFGREFVHM